MSVARIALAAAALALCATVVSSVGAEGEDDWSLRGNWVSVANPDDVRALAQAGDAIWAATASGGVARWLPDGTMQQYLAPQNGLPCNDVRDVAEWRGRWWFGTCEGLAVYNAARDRMEMISVPLPSPSVTALAVDGSDRLWVATEQWWDPDQSFDGKDRPGGWVGGGVAYSDDGVNWPSVEVAEGLSSANARDIVAWRGSVWVATEPYQRWVPPTVGADGEEAGRWEQLGGGVAQFDGTSWRTHDSNGNTELSDSARAIAADADALWVGTHGRGLVAFDGGKWQALQDCGDELRCIQDDYVTALAVSDDGAVWVGTSRFNGRGTGVGVLDDRGTPTDPEDDAWHVIRGSDGLSGELVHAIEPIDADASVWIGVAHLDPEGRTQGRGLAHLMSDRRTIASVTSADTASRSLSGNDITAVAHNAATGELWVGTGRSGLSVRLPSGEWEHYTTESTMGALASNSIADIAIEPSGVVWVATRQTTFDTITGTWTDGGLSRFDGLEWTTIKGTESGLPSDHLSALALDDRGKLWIGTGATDRGPKELAHRGWGLAVVDTTTQEWERTFTFPTLASNNITDIVVTGNLVWVTSSYFFYVDPRPGGAQIRTGGGVSVHNMDTGKWSNITSDQGLTPALREGSSTKPLLDLRAILVEPDGGIWAGGMAYPDARFDPDVVPDGVVDLIGTDHVDTHIFTAAGSVLSLAADPSGYVWVATQGDGVWVRLDGEWLHRRRERGGLPSSDISRISFDGGEVWFGTAGHGLVQLVPVEPEVTPETPAPGATPGPTKTPVYHGVVVGRLTNHLYLPAVKRGVLGDLIGRPSR